MASLLSCAPGDAKAGLGPNENDPAVIVITPGQESVSAGEAVLLRASGLNASGQPVAVEMDWTSTGGTLSTLTDSTAQFSAALAGSYTVRGRGRKPPHPTDSTTIVVTQPVSPIVSIAVSPSSATLTAGAVQAFVASASRQDGTTLVPSVSWSATGGTITPSGIYTAGTSAGNYRVVAVQQGGSLADTSAVTVTVTPPVLQAVILTPPSASLSTGGTQQFSVAGQWSDGSTTSPAVTYTATGGTITTGGLYTAGTTAGNFRVIAKQQGGSLADTSSVTVSATPPVLQAVILIPASANLNTGATQQFSVSGQWSDGSTTSPAVTYTATGGSITTGGLYTAGSTAGSFRVIAKQQGGTLADTAAVGVSASAGAVLVSEDFESGNLGSHGWFDATTVSIANDSRPGSPGTHALQWHWTPGAVTPQGVSRIDFTPSTSVYLSYWVKQSSNWVGSGVSYHPHMFHFLTTADDHWIGPSRTHLTLYDELLYVPARGGSVVTLAMQDALMIDAKNLMVDLTNVSEQRAIGGYNGRPESGLLWDAYDAGGGQYTNYKTIQPTTLVMTDASKNSWHHVESFWQLNTIVAGKGQPDGVVQYWFDGTLVVDRHDLYFRTSANSSMSFRTFVMGPYIGVGSPVDQYMWIDDLIVRTARP